MKPRWLQIANVGQICGGTAACAWTVTQALPGFEHQVAFLSAIHEETRCVFTDCALQEWSTVSVDQVQAIRPDVVLLHNISPQKLKQRLPLPTVQYVHSAGNKAVADVTVYCSRWLADQCGGTHEDVLWQAVPQVMSSESRTGDGPLIVGRICTPQRRKWPRDGIEFYREMVSTAPAARWEFVGCPVELQHDLQQACLGRAAFFAAGWDQRQRLATWDVLLYHHSTLSESFGRVVAEAMRAGCIPIVDDAGGFREQLDDGGGFLCQTVADFQHALRQVADPLVRQALAAQAANVGQERWSLDRFAKALLTTFDLAAEHARSRSLEPLL